MFRYVLQETWNISFVLLVTINRLKPLVWSKDSALVADRRAVITRDQCMNRMATAIIVMGKVMSIRDPAALGG